MNMKNILRLMGAFTVAVTASNAVVACGDKSNPGVTLNGEVAKQLGLTSDDKGTGLEEATIDVSKPDVASWTISALTTPIKASKLLKDSNADSEAANKACADFITGTLKIAAKDGKFSKDELDKIVGEVTNIKPILAKAKTGNDYAITGGNFSFQFKNSEQKPVGDIYAINLKTDAEKGVIVPAITAVATNLKEADTDVTTNSKILFAKDNKIPEGVKGTEVKVTGKQFLALNEITGLKIMAIVEKFKTGTEGTWVDGSTLELSYKTADVTFDPATIKTTFTIS